MIAMLDHDIRHVPGLWARSEVLGVIVGIDLVAAEGLDALRAAQGDRRGRR